MKSERQKQTLHINAFTWNLETWYRSSYLQNRNRDKDIENKCMDPKGGKGGGTNREIEIDVYKLLILCMKWSLMSPY